VQVGEKRSFIQTFTHAEPVTKNTHTQLSSVAEKNYARNSVVDQHRFFFWESDSDVVIDRIIF